MIATIALAIYLAFKISLTIFAIVAWFIGAFIMWGVFDIGEIAAFGDTRRIWLTRALHVVFQFCMMSMLSVLIWDFWFA